MDARLLTRTNAEQLIDAEELAPAMRNAFRQHSTKREIPGNRYFSTLNSPGEMMILAPGLSADIPAYSVKVHAKYPEQDPGIRGVLLLNDLQTGALLAVMDSTHITAVRTGLSAAIATDILARKDACNVAVIGAGKQNRFHLRYLSQLRSISAVTIYDTSIGNANAFIKELQPEINIDMTICDSLPSALTNSDILLTATWCKEPFLFCKNVPEGSHITTLGADQPGEAELSAELIQRSNFVCDDRDLAVSMGAIGGVNLDELWIDAELGEVIGGKKPGRQSASQITIYGAVGVPFQDLVIAWHVFDKAREQNVGGLFNFLA